MVCVQDPEAKWYVSFAGKLGSCTNRAVFLAECWTNVSVSTDMSFAFFGTSPLLYHVASYIRRGDLPRDTKAWIAKSPFPMI